MESYVYDGKTWDLAKELAGMTKEMRKECFGYENLGFIILNFEPCDIDGRIKVYKNRSETIKELNRGDIVNVLYSDGDLLRDCIYLGVKGIYYILLDCKNNVFDAPILDVLLLFKKGE